ncbi:hypothetical protein AY600_15520 [Phormidium willei BDU 130791]|nr:hypothetical protein AY600_15520 [Phormidium willei BDU 130791]
MSTSPALLALTALLVPKADATELALMPPDTIPPPVSDAQPEFEPDMALATSGAIAQPEIHLTPALISDTGSLLTQYVRFYQVLLLSIALSPLAAMTVFAVLRRRMVQYLSEEVRQELQSLGDLETELESRAEQADQLLGDLEHRLERHNGPIPDEVDSVSQAVEVQLAEIQELDGFRDQRLRELQELLWTMYCNHQSERQQLAHLTPETLLRHLTGSAEEMETPPMGELLELPETESFTETLADEMTPDEMTPDETLAEGESLSEHSPDIVSEIGSDEAPSSPDSREGWLAIARDCEKDGRWPEAIAAYEQALTYPASNSPQTASTAEEAKPAFSPDNTASAAGETPREDNSAVESSPQPPSFEQLKQVAQEAGDRRQWPACITACQQALTHQNDAHLQKLLGNAFQALGQATQAQDSYRQALRLKPDFAEVYANLGSLYAQQKHWPKAIECFRRALRLQPQLAAAYRNFAKVWEQVGNEREALDCWHQALAIDPDWAQGKDHLALGNRWVKLDRWDMAQSCYRRAIACDANLLDAWHNLAEVLAHDQQWHAARETYETLLQQDSQRILSQLGYGRVLAGLQDWPAAIAQYSYLAEVAPTQVLAQQRFAQRLTEAELYSEAIAVYQRALQFAPQAFELQLGLTELLCQAEQWEAGLEAAQRAIALNPQVAKAHYYAGRCQVAQERWQDAAHHLQQAVSLDPQFFWGQYFWGKSLLALQQWQTAADVLEGAMPLNPEFHWGYVELGQAWMQLEMYHQAVEAFQQAQALAPETPWLAKKLADALRGRALADIEQAVSWYRQAIAEHPEDLDNYHRALDLKSNDVDLYVQLADELARQNQDSGAITFYQMALQLQDRPDIKAKLQDLLKKKIK